MSDRLERAKALRSLGELERRRPGGGARAAYEQAVALLREEGEPLRLAHAIRDLYAAAGISAGVAESVEQLARLARRAE